MGCDGGTIPRRDELVRVKKKPEQVDKNAENAAKWKHCAISQQPLRPPIVSCELGKLYNKEAVIEQLLAKDTISQVAKHIRNLSDVKELNLTLNNGYNKEQVDKGNEYVDVHASRFICPVSGVEMNGKQKFCYNWKCGCVLSEKAMKEIKSETCHKCGKPVQEEDIIILNGSEDEVALLTERMEKRRVAAKLEKKRKKASQSATSEEKRVKVDLDQPSTSKACEMNGVNGTKEKLPAKKVAKTSNGTTGNEVTVKKLMLPEKAQPGYSIAKDPSASAAYKSLFTSHEKAKNQTKAHWVTHNPLYF